MNVLVILFLILGIVMLTGKGSFLVAGYNTMSEEKKKRYNEKRITQAVGVVALLASGYIYVMENMKVSEGLLNIIFIVMTLLIVVLINVHPYFKNSSGK